MLIIRIKKEAFFTLETSDGLITIRLPNASKSVDVGIDAPKNVNISRSDLINCKPESEIKQC